MINRRLLPLKVHYFFFMGAMSSILPFVMVIVKQLGIPVVVQGIASSVILLITVIAKPLLSFAVDAFPKVRKLLFLSVLSLVLICGALICVLPPMHDEVSLTGTISILEEDSHDSSEYVNATFLQPELSSCYVNEAWDCYVSCPSGRNQSTFTIYHMVLANNKTDSLTYDIKKGSKSVCDNNFKAKFTCFGGQYTGECKSIFSVGYFWLFMLMYAICKIGYASINSISDAITMDTVGPNGDFGAQRTWATIGWGLLGPIAGLLIDWFSRDTYSKSSLPILVLVILFGSVDLSVCSSKLKVPSFEGDGSTVWSNVGKVLKKPFIPVFFLFAILNGSVDGIVYQYIFVLQEDMAKGTHYMNYIKIIQGFTIGIQCAMETPFMWLSYWFIKKLQPVGVTKLVLFVFIFRLFFLALAGSYGPVWLTLIIEILNGPCFGLGYIAIVTQAGNITPPGTSATMQSIVNICYATIGAAFSSFLGGILYHRYGAPGMYYIFGCIATVTFISYMIASRWLDELNHRTTETGIIDENSIENDKIELNNLNKEKEISDLNYSEKKENRK